MQPPQLYLLVGYPGSGKTTVSKIIAKSSGAVHLWADKERLALFGVPTHSKTESQQLYSQLNKITDELLAIGHSVIFDTNFNFSKDRQLLRQIADKHGAQTTIIWLTTPKEIAKQRAVHDRNLRNGYEFKMPEADFERMASHLEPPRESENVIKIDGTQIDEDHIKQLLHLE